MMKKTDKLSLFRKLQTYIPFILLSINYLTIILSFRSSPFSHLLNDHDSSMFLYFGKAMNAGLTPYINMLDHKGILDPTTRNFDWWRKLFFRNLDCRMHFLFTYTTLFV